MKLVNEKGKLFGVINLIDLLVIVFILLVAGGVLWKVFGAQISGAIDDYNLSKQDLERVTYTVKIMGVEKVYYDEAKKIGFPQQLAVNDGPVDNCYLVGIEIEPARIITTDSDGNTSNVLYDSRYNLICTIKADILPGDFMTVGTQEVRIGKSHIVKTQFFELTGVIQTIDVDVAAYAPGMTATEG